MKKLLLFIFALLSLSISAQKFESAYCWYDNSTGRFNNVANRYVHPAMQPFSMYIVDKAHRMPATGSGSGAGSLTKGSYEAGAIVYVLPGKQLDHLKQMEHMFMQPVYDSLVVWTAETEESRKKGGGQYFLFPVGPADRIFVKGKEETVAFMGVNDAKHIDYTLDFGKSPLFLSLFNAQALQLRFHMYRYYDPSADKSALVIFLQCGLDREYEGLENELDALAALLGGLSSQLIMSNPANSQTLKDWIKNSTWKDIQPDFERYFHLKPAAKAGQGPTPTDETLPPPPTFPNDSTILVYVGGKQEPIHGLYPVPPDPILVPNPTPIPPEARDPKNPVEPGQRILFADAVTLTNGGCFFAENDTATYMVASKQSIIYGINKTTGSFSVDSTATVCTSKLMITGAGCLKDGRLLIYQTQTGVYDVFNRKVLLKEKEKTYDTHHMVVNPVTNRVYIYYKGVMEEYDAQLRLLTTYQCPLSENEFKTLRVAPDGRIWIEIGKGYWTQAYTTFLNGKFTPVMSPEQPTCLSMTCPYVGGSYLAMCTTGLYEMKPTVNPAQIFTAEWRTFQGAALNSKNELFVIHDNRTLERLSTKGGVRSEEIYQVDLRFTRKGMQIFQSIYIDSLDNLWINTGKDIYVWHPSGKLNGYGSFCGKVSAAME